MKIQDLLKPASIIIHADVETKEQAIAALIDKHDEAGNLTDKEVYTQGILKRESEGTTAIGEGIAIPHCKSDAVCNPGLAAMTVPGGIDYDAPDGQPSNLVFMIAAPMDGDLHLEVLARLMTLLMDLDLRKQLLQQIAASSIAGRIDVQERDSGLHFLLKLNTRRPDAELRELLSSRGINLLPLSAYYRNPDNAPENTFVFNYSSLDTSVLEQALPVLAEFI